MKRFAVVVFTVAALVISAAPAAAAAPNHQACLGTTVSSAAQTIPDYGALVAGVARSGPVLGVGDDVQAILAGQVPDALFPNTCND